jgi:hypothetical protein
MAGLETLDEFLPRDTDPVSLGDDNIRETRAKTKTSFGSEHYLDGPHKIPGGAQSLRPAAGRVGRLYFNTDLKTAEYDTGSVWSSSADAKARATILWHGAQFGIPSGAERFEAPFDYIMDDPGGFANIQYHQIVQPVNSMGIVSCFLEFAPPTGGGYGIWCNIEQYDTSTTPAWRILTKGFVGDAAFVSMNTMVDSRWGQSLRVTISNYTPAAMYVNATSLGASPRFGYAMFGRTA